jgi:hypothetical protein
MSVFTRTDLIRTFDVQVPVPVTVISGDRIPVVDGVGLLDERVLDLFAAFVDGPGFIGFKAPLTGDLTELLAHSPYNHLFMDNVTPDPHVVELGIYGQLNGPLIGWDRKVYVMNDESGVLEPVFEIPEGAELWLCEYVTESTCGSLTNAFFSWPARSLG